MTTQAQIEGLGEFSQWGFTGDGYNLYRDDATDTGNIDEVYGIWTLTPDKIDLPNTGAKMGPLTVMWGESPDTWYWSTEARGYNLPEPEPPKPGSIAQPGPCFGNLIVIVCGNTHSYAWSDEISLAEYYTGMPLQGKTLAEDVAATGCGYELVIPAGTEVTGLEGGYASFIEIKKASYPNSYLIIAPNFVLSAPAILYLDGVEVMRFTRVVGGAAS